jgi:hypothetical protein
MVASGMKRSDWWAGIGLLTAAILLHGALRRYEIFPSPRTECCPIEHAATLATMFPDLVRLDRRSGKIESGTLCVRGSDGRQWKWTTFPQ